MRRREAGWPTGTCPDEAKAVLAGVRSPPLRWVASLGERPRGKTRGQCGWWFSRRGAVSASALEGRTQAPVWHDGREVDEGPVAYWGNGRVKPMVSLRACGARPSAKGPSRGERPCGEDPGMMRKALFSEGRTLCARLARPHGCRGISLRPHPLMRAPGPSGDMPRVKPVPSLRACGARPSPGLTIRGKLAFRPRAGNHAKSDSFGRAPSVRPDCEAGLSP